MVYEPDRPPTELTITELEAAIQDVLDELRLSSFADEDRGRLHRRLLALQAELRDRPKYVAPWGE